MDKVYKSKIDLGLVTPLVFSFVVIETLMIGQGEWTGAVLVGVVVLFIGYMFMDTYYKVTGDGVLKVRGGFLVNRKIEISRIKSVMPTNSI
ncbi:MAG: PH domain-containing protein, partial [Bacteroidetes bacterium]|nr:PH domain-containing protein [Bacteroidota bacterium]